MKSRNQREGRYAGRLRDFNIHIRGGNQSYEFNIDKKPSSNKAAYITGCRRWIWIYFTEKNDDNFNY